MPDLKNVPPSPRPRRLSQLKDAWKNKRSVTIVYLLRCVPRSFWC